MKTKPKSTLKLAFWKKSKAPNGSFLLLKEENKHRTPKPTKYKIKILRIENRTDSNKVILVQSHHIIITPQIYSLNGHGEHTNAI
jgi:SepF-like predicted cell division protein (DUF552 family)